MRNIVLNRNRLIKGYDLSHIFRESTYDWPGDTEGRALLAFVSHYKISKRKIKWMDLEISEFKNKFNKEGYFGHIADLNEIDEQQVAGHSWLLRGLLEYYLTFHDNICFEYAKNIVNKLFVPILPFIKNYPLKRENNNNGGVSGNSATIQNGWKLSTDIGCVFISLDGLSQYYEITKDNDVRALINELIALFKNVDLVQARMQTHATLSASRGIYRFYRTTLDKSLLELVINKFNLYESQGMTLTYENYNWFNRKDTWTEPCAVVDSLILAISLYKETNKNHYLTLARRIWFNGLNFCLRDNGGAGPNSCADVSQPILYVAMYEAYFCCTMRYAEGLYWYFANKNLFTFDITKKEVIDEYGRHFVDDCLVAKSNNKKVILSLVQFDKKDDYLKAKFEIIY